MNFAPWEFSIPSDMLNSMQQGPFPTNVSSYFRRPSKIVKPSSRNNSPRTSSRRRMTTAGHMPTRTRSVVDHQRSSMPHLSDAHAASSRPISWHPNMLDEMSQYPITNHGMVESFMNTPYTTAEINGLVTPMSYPIMDEPQIQELITPLEGLSANESGCGLGYGQDLDMTQYWLSQQAKDSVVDFDPSLYPMANYQPWYTTNQYIMPNVPTAPTSPSFLPMPEFGTPLHVPVPDVETEDESEELVAMGLYDSPADVQSSSLLFGGTGFTARKTLKLEDSFEPSVHDEDDDDDDDEDEDAIASEEDDDQPGVSPTTLEQPLHSTTDAISLEQYAHAQMMDNSTTHGQWRVPNQNGYNWI